MNTNQKKGISLVELTIAMTILTMVFAGTVTLIIMIVNLAYSAGMKTTAVSLAQKGLTETITGYRGNPPASITDPPTCVTTTTGLPAGISSQIKCIGVPTMLSSSYDAIDGDVAADSFVLVSSEVTWYVKGSVTPLSYKISQIINKGDDEAN